MQFLHHLGVGVSLRICYEESYFNADYDCNTHIM